MTNVELRFCNRTCRSDSRILAFLIPAVDFTISSKAIESRGMHCFNALVLFATLLVGQEADLHIKSKNATNHSIAVANGRAEAARELRRGKAMIWTYGLNMKLFLESIDRETGLYFSSFGCVIDDEIIGQIEGHNAKIMEYIRVHGPPKNSLKPWEKQLFALKDYFEKRCLTEKPVRLTIGGPAVSSPGGEYVVRLVNRPDVKNGRPVDSLWIIVGEKDIESQRTPLWSKDAELWGLRGQTRGAPGSDGVSIAIETPPDPNAQGPIQESGDPVRGPSPKLLSAEALDVNRATGLPWARPSDRK